jgi:CBS domain-containing protein
MARLSSILGKRAPIVNLFEPEHSVAHAVQAMRERHVGAVLIAERGRLVGIFSERDLVNRVIATGRPLEEVCLRDVMTRDPITAAPSDDRMSAIRKMRAAGCRHLPILADDRIVDTVSIRDLLFDEIKERESEIAELKRYIQGT